MTIRSVGYDGAISEADWSAWLAPYIGSPDTVIGPRDFQVTPATANLSVSVAPGTAHGYGVTDTSDATETLQLEPVTSGVRFDCIVLRRDWSGTSVTPTGAPTGGRTTVGYVKGGTAQTVPPLTRNGGSLTEQPLALVKVSAGSATVAVTDDLRANHAKAAYARSLLAMTGPVGTRYTLEPDGRRYVVRPDASGAPAPVLEWEPPAPTIPAIPRVKSGTASVDFSAGFGDGVGHIVHNLGYRPATVHCSARTTMTSGMVEVTLSTQAGSINETYFAVNAKTVSATGAGWVPYTGNLTYVDWVAIG